MSFSRRNFLKTAGVAAGAVLVPPVRGDAVFSGGAQVGDQGSPDYTIRIAASAVEIAPKKIISMTTYNGQFPGPLLRFKEGQQVTVDLINDTDKPEQLHWHGQMLPVDVDGAAEEGTPYIPGRGRRRISIVAKPSGYRFYHTHIRAGADLSAGQVSTAVRSGICISSRKTIRGHMIEKYSW